jgi:enoyl-CoA hydratase
MEYKNILVEETNGIAVVTINRPAKLNALNNETLDELNECFLSIRNDGNIKVVIITGAGEKAFIAGADISELNNLTFDTAESFALKGQAVFNLIAHLDKPVIAAVNGFALGGGCELALACHLRIASDKAKFAQPEINLGTIPGYGGTQRLTRLINSGRAAEMILTGDMIGAEEALRIGLVNKVFPAGELMMKTFELAGVISSKSKIAVSMALRAITGCTELSLQSGLNLEAELFTLCCGSEDFKEGTAAFLEKRKPIFKNK